MQVEATLPLVTTRLLDDFRRIVRVLRNASRAVERRIGVSGAQLFVLKALSSNPSLTINALAARTCTHQSTVSMVVKRLVKAGLVSRSVSPLDGRRVELALTARGRALLRRAPEAPQEELIKGIERLSLRQRDSLAVALRNLVNAMNLGDEAPPMLFEDDEPSRRGRRPSSRSSRSKT